MRPTKQIREEMEELLLEYHRKNNKLEEELKRSIKHKQKHCKHPREKVVTTTEIMQGGDLYGTNFWIERTYCKRCGKTLEEKPWK